MMERRTLKQSPAYTRKTNWNWRLRSASNSTTNATIHYYRNQPDAMIMGEALSFYVKEIEPKLNNS